MSEMKTFHDVFPSRDYLPSARTAFDAAIEAAAEHYGPRIEALHATCREYEERIAKLQAEVERLMAAQEAHARDMELRAALRELTAMVRGECPALLCEDSGGDAKLSMLIDDLLEKKP